MALALNNQSKIDLPLKKSKQNQNEKDLCLDKYLFI